MASRPPSTPSPAPVGRLAVEARGRSEAPIDRLWPLVGQAHRWKEWSFLTGSRLIAEGEPDAEGVGAMRHLTVLGIGSREAVVAWEPPGHLAYRIVRGFPVRNHRADVVLVADGTGTTITWSATFDQRIPGTGRIMTAVMQALLRRFVVTVTRYADRGGGPV